MYEIYVHTNRSNGKRYVGLTKRGTDHRWFEHVTSSTKPRTRFSAAIHKHGFEAFDHEIICECETLKEANVLEQHFIEMLNTWGPLGYNMSAGGDSVFNASPESRMKMSIARKARAPMSAETRKKLAAVWTGRKHTDETRQKMRESAKHHPVITEEGRQKIREANMRRKKS